MAECNVTQRSAFAERVRGKLHAGKFEAYMHERGDQLRPLTSWLKTPQDFDAAEAAVLQHFTREQIEVRFIEEVV